VTPGASGIGFAIAGLFHKQGVGAAICDIDPEALGKANLNFGQFIQKPLDDPRCHVSFM
jgi:NAD(P)-dependent dehydrogenase (short-subunit alcohol dehydrogenase family)